MQTIDPRWIYALLLAFIIVPLLAPDLPFPVVPSQQSIDFYDTVENTAKNSPNKLVIVNSMWASGTRGEQQWQSQAIFRHLMARHLKFATLTFDTQNATLTKQVVARLAKEYGYVYGRDYVDFGYRPYQAYTQTAKALTDNIPKAIKKDATGQPIESFPVMQGVHNTNDVGLIILITPVGDLGLWVGLVQGVYHTPMLYAPTSVMAPDSYPYLDSGQLSGLLTGIKGAGDYEYLLTKNGIPNAKSFGTRATGSLSLIYLLLIILIVIGNIGYHKERSVERAAAK